MPKGKRLQLYTGNGNRPLAQRVASYIGQELGNAEVSRHPDGEVKVKFEDDLRGAHVVIIQPTNPPETNLKELKLMAYAARGSSAACVTAVIPYLGYGRQDRKDERGVAIACRMVADEIIAAGIQHVILLDLHAAQSQGFFDPTRCIVDHIYGRPVFISLFRRLGLTDFVTGPPDVGRAKTAEAYMNKLGGDMFFAVKRKKNDRAEGVRIIGEVEGCRTRIVDDEISTASTIRHAAAALREGGAREIHAVASHGKCIDGAAERMEGSAITKFFIGDSVVIPDAVSVALRGRLQHVTFAPLLGEAIKHLHDEERISPLFDDHAVGHLYRDEASYLLPSLT